jgi:ubiquinone biosynthesis protein
MKQRKDAKKAEPDTNGRLKEILAVLKKYNYDDGITPEITVNILEDLGPTFVKIGQIASQQTKWLPWISKRSMPRLRSIWENR